jgi:hypothetical protein
MAVAGEARCAQNYGGGRNDGIRGLHPCTAADCGSFIFYCRFQIYGNKFEQKGVGLVYFSAGHARLGYGFYVGYAAYKPFIFWQGGEKGFYIQLVVEVVDDDR